LDNEVTSVTYEDSGAISSIYTSKGECSINCNTGFFFSTINFVCEPCSTDCLSCRDLNLCYNCDSSKELHTFDADHASCKDWCQPDEYRENTIVGLCASCDTSCTQCHEATFQDCQGSTCSPTYEKMNEDIAAGTFSCFKICNYDLEFRVEATGLCNNCFSGCLGCLGPDSDDCTDCRDNFILNKDSPGAATGSCECPLADGFYQSGITCGGCNPSCATCTGPDEQDCIGCSDGYIELRNSLNLLQSCSENCPRTNEYYDSINFSCEFCDTACSTCYGPNPNNCLSCPLSLLLHIADCVVTCPLGFATRDGLTCVPCTDANCELCSQQNPDLCLHCDVGYADIEGACSDTCPEGKVLVYSESTCNRCPTSCRNCSLDPLLPYLPENLNCTSCANPTDILENGQCTCLECHTVDPSDSTIGVIQTYDGQCLRCDQQNGLITNFDATLSFVESCEEICGDSILHALTKKYMDEKMDTDGALSGGLIISNTHLCDDGNLANGDGCNSGCQV